MATVIDRLRPYLGVWEAKPAGPGPASAMPCRREFRATPGGAFVTMSALWNANGLPYEEVAVFGRDQAGRLSFTSRTADGEQSSGEEADGAGLPDRALVFVARMPAGLARFIYWPITGGGFHLAVESEDAGGWNRFMEQRYLRGS